MNERGYNGWTNYETWVVALWMDNNAGDNEYWLDRATEYAERHDDPALRTVLFSDELKAYHEEQLPEIQGFASDLLSAAMSEVNWREIAAKFLADATEQAGA